MHLQDSTRRDWVKMSCLIALTPALVQAAPGFPTRTRLFGHPPTTINTNYDLPTPSVIQPIIVVTVTSPATPIPTRQPYHDPVPILDRTKRIPLPQACAILRQVYDKTGGPFWTRQDGWHPIAPMPVMPPMVAGPEPPVIGIPGPGDQRVPSPLTKLQRRGEETKQGGSDDGPSGPVSTSMPPAQDTPRVTRTTNQLLLPTMSVDPILPPLTIPTRVVPGTGGRIPPPAPPEQEPAEQLDPENCCGWQGVVCIGPDGVMHSPWPPYDETPEGDGSKEIAMRKRGEDSSHFHSHHLKKKPHHGAKSHGGKGTHHQKSGPKTTKVSTQPVKPSEPKMDTSEWMVVELHLGFNNLVGPIPPILGTLTDLMVLDMANNQLSGSIPDSLANLTSLRRLDLSANEVVGTFPTSITKLSNLQELILKNNYLKGELPQELLKLKQLTQLSIANNELEGMLPMGLFSSLQKLEVFSISQNGFTGEISPEVGGLSGLTIFAARANEFSGRIPDEFGLCSNLEALNLGDNHLIGEIPDSIFNLINLKVLDLPDNKLAGVLSPKIGQLSSLTKLVLSHNEFSGPLPVEIQNLVQLELLVINYNDFNGTFPTALAPAMIDVCMVQPNAFTSCPSNSSLETPSTLAYKCNLDCSDRVIHPEIYDAIGAAPGSIYHHAPNIYTTLAISALVLVSIWSIAIC